MLVSQSADHLDARAARMHNGTMCILCILEHAYWNTLTRFPSWTAEDATTGWSSFLVDQAPKRAVSLAISTPKFRQLHDCGMAGPNLVRGGKG